MLFENLAVSSFPLSSGLKEVVIIITFVLYCKTVNQLNYVAVKFAGLDLFG